MLLPPLTPHAPKLPQLPNPLLDSPQPLHPPAHLALRHLINVPRVYLGSGEGILTVCGVFDAVWDLSVDGFELLGDGLVEGAVSGGLEGFGEGCGWGRGEGLGYGDT